MNALHPNGFRQDRTGRATSAVLNIPELDPARLAADVVIQFRHHSHFNNVLTHVSRDNWPSVERALAALLGNLTGPLNHDALSINLLALLSGGRGTTGRLMKPWFAEQVCHYTTPACSRSLERGLAMLHARYASAPVAQKKSAARIIWEAK